MSSAHARVSLDEVELQYTPPDNPASELSARLLNNNFSSSFDGKNQSDFPAPA
jgi:hypothetical protein